MLFHWRILENKGPQAKIRWDREAINKDVTYWNNSLAVKRRLEAIMNAKARVILFCEYFPLTLEAWLCQEVQADEGRAAKAIDFVDQSLVATNRFMAQQEMVHFDAHFRNIVTNGTQLIFSDFGLALSSHQNKKGIF